VYAIPTTPLLWASSSSIILDSIMHQIILNFSSSHVRSNHEGGSVVRVAIPQTDIVFVPKEHT
jgi:hypothetical protein